MGKLLKIYSHPLVIPIAITLSILMCVGVSIGLVILMLDETFMPKLQLTAEQIEAAATESGSASALLKTLVSNYEAATQGTINLLGTVISILSILLLSVLAVFLMQMRVWNLDKRKLNKWQEQGIIYERLEFLSGNRLRIDNIEIEVNKAQMQTLMELVKSRVDGNPLHSADIQSDNGAQMIKRLREEIGCRLIEKTFIKNQRGKGYWLNIEPVNIKLPEQLQ